MVEGIKPVSLWLVTFWLVVNTVVQLLKPPSGKLRARSRMKPTSSVELSIHARSIWVAEETTAVKFDGGRGPSGSGGLDIIELATRAPTLRSTALVRYG